VKTTNVRVHRGPCCGTDHYLVKATFYITPRQLMEKMKHEKNYQKCDTIKYNLYSLTDKSTITLYQQHLVQKLDENGPELVETLYEHIWICIHSVAGEALGEQGKRRKGGRKFIWSEEIAAVVRRRKAYI
jgi:hypothetical protein